jgi:hypothetical protein
MRAISYFAWAVTLALCAGLLMGQVNRQRRTGPELSQFRKPLTGEGTGPSWQRAATHKGWKKMSLAAKNAALADYGLHLSFPTPEVTLSPKHPTEGEGACLAYSNIGSYNTQDDFLTIKPTGAVAICFDPIGVGKPHLVTFTVDAAHDCPVDVWFGGQKVSFFVKKGDESCVSVVVTPSKSSGVSLYVPEKASEIWFHSASVQLVK